MKNSTVSTPTNGHSNPTSNSASKASCNVKEDMASFFMQSAIQILNSKGYSAEYIIDRLLPGRKPFFNESNSAKSFCKFPKGFKPGGIFDGNLTLVYNIGNTKSESEGAEKLLKAAENFHEWAELLPEAITICIDIDVPEGEDPDDLAMEFSEELSLHDYEIQDDKEFFFYSFRISPEMMPRLSREIKKVAKANGTIASLTKLY